MNDDRNLAPLEPLERALQRVGDRWSLLVIDALTNRPRRFNELSDALPIAPNILTARLRQLERDGLVTATPYSRRPLRFAYELAEPGRELAGTIAQLVAWGARHHEEPPGGFHDACGTALEVRPYCPTCERVVNHDESIEVHHL